MLISEEKKIKNFDSSKTHTHFYNPNKNPLLKNIDNNLFNEEKNILINSNSLNKNKMGTSIMKEDYVLSRNPYNPKSLIELTYRNNRTSSTIYNVLNKKKKEL